MDVNIKMSSEELKQQSRFYGKGNPEASLTPYESAINEASYKLVLDDGSLINNRGRLLNAARKKVHDDGYQYQKKASRSKSFGIGLSSSTTPKRPRYSSELRGKRILEVKEDLEDLATQIQYADKSQEKFANVQQYEAASSMCKEISSLKLKKRKLEAELSMLEKMDFKSQSYYKSKEKMKVASTSNKCESTSGSIKDFLKAAEEKQEVATTGESSNQHESDKMLPSLTESNLHGEEQDFLDLAMDENQTKS